MNPHKEKAIELRRLGKSYKDIRREVGVSLSTLSGWFKNEDWSMEIRDRLGREQSLAFPKKLEALTKANKARWALLNKNYRESAEKEFELLKKNPLFFAGIMLYWGEGEKNPKQSRIKLTNSDPVMIRFFYSFLRDCVGIPAEKIHVWLLLYPDLKDEMQKNFWSKATGIPISQFKESVYIKGRQSTKRLSYGVCNVFVQGREFKEKFMTWIELCQKMLM